MKMRYILQRFQADSGQDHSGYHVRHAYSSVDDLSLAANFEVKNVRWLISTMT